MEKRYTIEEAARKARSLKAIAEQGEPGERDNARRLLEQLAKKYGITAEEISEEKRSLHWFRYSQEIEKRLLSQIVYMVTGRFASGCVGAMSGRKRKQVGIECTEAERVEIESNYEFYKDALYKEIDVFMCAFTNKNNLFPPSVIDADKKDGEIDIEKIRKAIAMMDGMDIHIMQKALTEKAD